MERAGHKTSSLHSSIHDTSSRGSIFSNFETVKMSTEERLYLHAARLGEVGLLKELLEAKDAKLNVNCVDYMGRSALFLAVDSENVESIEILMERLSWGCIEEALLHAISGSQRNIVRIIVDHPAYLAGEKRVRQPSYLKDKKTYRSEEKYQFPPDVTPLTLASEMNDHELVQLFLSRGQIIERPHAIDCHCQSCQVKQQSDSLKRSLSRLNAYKALSSPAYMALSSPDPITTTFELRQEMKKVAHVEKEFHSEYAAMIKQCMDFACELMDLCRGTQEVEAVLGEETTGSRDPLARLRLAIEYGEKKFVAHSNCQQHLTNIWYGKEMGFLKTLSLTKKTFLSVLAIPCLPFIYVGYIIDHNTKMSRVLRCPVTKFITHTISHFTFLFLLALATFGFEDVFSGVDADHPNQTSPADNALYEIYRVKSKLRPLRSSITLVQYIIICWIIGLLWIECKQIYHAGVRDHFMQYYNFMDFSVLALYLASYALRWVVQFRIQEADRYFNATSRAEAAAQVSIHNHSKQFILDFLEDITNESKNQSNWPYAYFISAWRFDWSPEDPEIVAEILFAIANVMSFARTTYIMPSHELLGPLQISLGRMLGDIARFVVLFLLVLVAFMVGMTNLYRYYGYHIDEKTQLSSATTFKGLPQTVHTLFFSIFGLIALDKLEINTPNKASGGSTVLVNQVGLLLFAIYLVMVTIVLVNILIAMMSHSFEDVQGDNDVEWKFARTKLWLNYIDEYGTLPVPFNMFPTPKSVCKGFSHINALIYGEEDMDPINYNFARRRENIFVPDPEAMNMLLQKSSTYSDIVQRIVRRYLFKLERQKKEEADRGVAAADEYSEEGDEEDEINEDKKEDAPSEKKDILNILVEEADPHAPRILPSPKPPLSPPPTFSRKVHWSPKPRRVRPEPDLSPQRSPIDKSPQHKECWTMKLPSPTSPKNGVPRSASDETIRQMTRRATLLRRSGTRRASRRHPKPNPDAQLDAIQRGQRMLDARLQDLQIARGEETFIRDNMDHLRRLMGEHQRALGSMVKAMDTIQEEIRNLTLYMAAGCRRTPSSASKGSHGKGSKGNTKSSVRKKRSDPTSV